MKPQQGTNSLLPGTRVRVIQKLMLADRPNTWAATVEGTVVACTPDKTGSWYAHGKDDRVWLLRLRIRKDDGEITDLVIDRGSRVEVLASPQTV